MQQGSGSSSHLLCELVGGTGGGRVRGKDPKGSQPVGPGQAGAETLAQGGMCGLCPPPSPRANYSTATSHVGHGAVDFS